MPSMHYERVKSQPTFLQRHLIIIIVVQHAHLKDLIQCLKGTRALATVSVSRNTNPRKSCDTIRRGARRERAEYRRGQLIKKRRQTSQ